MRVATVDNVATPEVEQGCDFNAWSTAGPHNQDCINDSDPKYLKRLGWDFWLVSDYNFFSRASQRRRTAKTQTSMIQKGYIIIMIVGPDSKIAVSSESNSNLHVEGLTNNSDIFSIELQDSEMTRPTYENAYYVNPPPRPGFALRVAGPELNYDNIGAPIIMLHISQ